MISGSRIVACCSCPKAHAKLDLATAMVPHDCTNVDNTVLRGKHSVVKNREQCRWKDSQW